MSNKYLLVYSKAAYYRVNKAATQTLTEACRQAFGTAQEGGRLKGNEFIFAFVRNPYTRIVSTYLNQIAQPTAFSRSLFKDGMHGTFWKIPGLYPGMPFKEFVEVVAGTPDGEANPHFRSQHKFFPLTGNEAPDFIGHYEHLHRDWQRVCEAVGVAAPELPNNNRTPRPVDYVSYFTRELKHLVGNRYKKDFQLFKYHRGCE